MTSSSRPLAQRERTALADLLEELGPDAPTLCAGWSAIDLATHAFGQGISTTPMQMVMAYAAIANVCAQHHYNYGRDPVWMERAVAASERAARAG